MGFAYSFISALHLLPCRRLTRAQLLPSCRCFDPATVQSRTSLLCPTVSGTDGGGFHRMHAAEQGSYTDGALRMGRNRLEQIGRTFVLLLFQAMPKSE